MDELILYAYLQNIIWNFQMRTRPNEFDWIFKAIGEYSPEIDINPKLLRILLSKVYKLVSSDIPKKELKYNFELLNSIAEGDEELPKLFGIANLSDAQAFHMNFRFTLTEVAQQLGYSSWYYADKLLQKIKEQKGVDLKATDNIYHVTIKTGNSSKSKANKYSDVCVDLLIKVRDGVDYELEKDLNTI